MIDFSITPMTIELYNFNKEQQPSADQNVKRKMEREKFVSKTTKSYRRK